MRVPHHRSAGYSLVEFVLALAVVAVITTLTTGMFLGARDNVTSTRSLSTAIQAHSVDSGYPVGMSFIQDLTRMLQPYPHLKLPSEYHWGHVYNASWIGGLGYSTRSSDKAG